MTEIAEVRVLVFSYQDVKKALTEFASKYEIQVPDREIEKITCSADSEDQLQIFFKSDLDPLQLKDVHKGKKVKDRALGIGEVEMKECLIELCRQRKIPIPMKATKELDTSRSSISMWIKLGESEDLPTPANM